MTARVQRHQQVRYQAARWPPSPSLGGLDLAAATTAVLVLHLIGAGDAGSWMFAVTFACWALLLVDLERTSRLIVCGPPQAAHALARRPADPVGGPRE